MKSIVYLVTVFCMSVLPLKAQDSMIQNPSDAVIDTSETTLNNKQSSLVKSDVDVITKTQADSAYIKADYEDAINKYENILKNQGESAAIYYNLGNSYYRNKDIAHSILNYERAHLLEPGDDDIIFNLEMARNQTVDKVEKINKFFLTDWIIATRNLLNADGWARGAVIFFLLTLVLSLFYLFGQKMIYRKIGFVGACICALMMIITNVFAYQQKSILQNRHSAIIMTPSVTVKSTPDSGGTDLFIVHEGHKVFIKDLTMKEWYEIQLEDGSIGWVPKDVVEII